MTEDTSQKNPEARCLVCRGDLKWPDGKVHAKVCLPCFSRLMGAKQSPEKKDR